MNTGIVHVDISPIVPEFRDPIVQSVVPCGDLTFETSAGTITPAIAVSGGPTPIWSVLESTGTAFIYTGVSFTHIKTGGTGAVRVRLANTEALRNFVTQINFNGDGITSLFSSLQLHKFPNCTYFHVGNNSLSGVFSHFVPPAGTTYLSVGTNVTLHGNLDYITLPSSLQTLYLGDNNFNTIPRIALGSSALSEYLVADNELSQSVVDQLVLDAYNNRANFTALTPTFNVSGSNSNPSGVYQDATPPTTALERVYKLVNDPDLEGFNKQSWTW